MRASDVNIAGKAATRITLGGDVLWERGGKEYEVLKWIGSIERQNNLYFELPAPIGLNPEMMFHFIVTTEQNNSLLGTDTANLGDGYGINPDGSFFIRYGLTVSQGWSDSGTIKDNLGAVTEFHFGRNCWGNIVLDDERIPLGAVNLEEKDLSMWADNHFRLFVCGKYIKYGMRIGHTEQFDDGRLVHDLYPARRLADGELGFYCTVTDQFLTKRGIGNLSAGPSMSYYI